MGYIIALLEAALIYLTADELINLGEELEKTANESLRAARKLAEKDLEKFIKKLEDEILSKIDADEQALLRLSNIDIKRQRQVTKKALGRKGKKEKDKSLITAAIKQNIPFRDVISLVCEKADKVPRLQLRKKKGAEFDVKDLKKLKSKLLINIIEAAGDTFEDIPDIEGFITVRLKQFTANLIFELIDEFLDWKTPIKAEACFGPPSSGYADPILDGGTKLFRNGSDIYPFYPLPYKGRGSISADIAIPDSRKKPLTKNNLFAIVEIKFQNDKIENKQFEQYDLLNDKCAEVKTSVTGISNTLDGKGVVKGCRVSLFRYPEDRAKQSGENEEQDNQSNKKKSGKKGRP